MFLGLCRLRLGVLAVSLRHALDISYLGSQRFAYVSHQHFRGVGFVPVGVIVQERVGVTFAAASTLRSLSDRFRR